MSTVITDLQHEIILNTVGIKYRLSAIQILELFKNYQVLMDRQLQVNNEASRQKCIRLGCTQSRVPLVAECEAHFKERMDRK